MLLPLPLPLSFYCSALIYNLPLLFISLLRNNTNKRSMASTFISLHEFYWFTTWTSTRNCFSNCQWVSSVVCTAWYCQFGSLVSQGFSGFESCGAAGFLEGGSIFFVGSQRGGEGGNAGIGAVVVECKITFEAWAKLEPYFIQILFYWSAMRVISLFYHYLWAKFKFFYVYSLPRTSHFNKSHDRSSHPSWLFPIEKTKRRNALDISLNLRKATRKCSNPS